MRVLTSGAGIAGSSLAWFLAKAGAHVTIVEKTPSILPVGQNIDIQGTARSVVKKMGLLEEVRRNGTQEKGTQFMRSDGTSFAPFPLQKGNSASGTSEFEILRGDLAKVFYDATKDHPSVDYIFGTTIEEVISNDEKGVKVRLSNGEVQEYDLLVAADGQWSKVRKQCFDPESIKVVDRNMTAVYWTVPRMPGDNDWWNVYMALENRVITTRPDPHGTIRAMFTYMPRSDADRKEWLDVARSDRATQNKFLRERFQDAGWQAERLLDAMDNASDFYFHTIQQIKMSKWHTGRVVCIGDAACAPSPLTGMGTSIAILCAYVLAGELSKLTAGEHPSRALEAYDNALRAFVEETQKVPSWVPGIAHHDSTLRRSLFHAAAITLSKLATIPWLANKLADGNDEDFKLPHYDVFSDHDGMTLKETLNEKISPSQIKPSQQPIAA